MNIETETASIEELDFNIRNNIINAAKCSIPTCNFKANHKALPDNIIELIKKRRLIRAEIRKFKRSEDKTTNNRLKKQINDEIYKIKNKEWNNFITKCGRNPLSTKPLWKKIKTLETIETIETI